MSTFFPKISTIATTKVHVIELYCYSDEYRDQVEHEIVTGCDAGPALATLYGQQVRFVYAPDSQKFDLVKNESQNRGCKMPLINLYEPDQVKCLIQAINHGDSILIHGQFDSVKESIAGRTAEDLVDILNVELELEKIKLNNLDLHACKAGQNPDFRNYLLNNLSNFKTITTYADLCSVSMRDGIPQRRWIRLMKDQDEFYGESAFEENGRRFIDATAIHSPSPD